MSLLLPLYLLFLQQPAFWLCALFTLGLWKQILRPENSGWECFRDMLSEDAVLCGNEKDCIKQMEKVTYGVVPEASVDLVVEH